LRIQASNRGNPSSDKFGGRIRKADSRQSHRINRQVLVRRRYSQCSRSRTAELHGVLSTWEDNGKGGRVGGPIRYPFQLKWQSNSTRSRWSGLVRPPRSCGLPRLMHDWNARFKRFRVWVVYLLGSFSLDSVEQWFC